MSYVRKSIDELSTRYGGVVRLARKDLGITYWRQRMQLN
jgi:hypothetical protein